MDTQMRADEFAVQSRWVLGMKVRIVGKLIYKNLL